MNAVEIAYSIPGQTWPSELVWLNSAFTKSQVHVEVGVYCGRSFYATCLGLPKGALAIAIDDDSQPTVGTGFPHPCSSWVSTIRNMVLQAIKDARPDLRVKFWKMPSLGAAVRLFTEISNEYHQAPKSVFIDGAHDFASVCADIETWGANLSGPSDVLCGHDYWPAHASVMDAVNHTLPLKSGRLSGHDVVPGTRIWVAK